MWWKILIAVLCGVLILSPLDIVPEAILGPLGGVDDIGYIVGIVASLISAFKGIGGKKKDAADDNVNDVADN